MRALVDVHTSAGDYTATVGAGVLDAVAGVVSSCNPDTIAVISHPKLMEWYGGRLFANMRHLGWSAITVTVPAGERSKSLSSAGKVLSQLAELGFTRGGVIVAFGGGVVGDLAGFVAAVYHRGARFIQVPTTLLAQVDASVGGKVGVDLPIGKNLIGAFLQPLAVIADTTTLATLPRRHMRNGMAEVLKYGFILRAPFINQVLEAQKAIEAKDADVLTEIVASSVEMKAAVVEEDELDRTGSRARLNFGHTVGHAIEAALGYRRLLHGEAISIGMVAEARISAELGLCPKDAPEIIERALACYSLPVRVPNDLDAALLAQRMRSDKKVEGGDLVMSLLREVGSCELIRGVDARIVGQVLEGMREGA